MRSESSRTRARLILSLLSVFVITVLSSVCVCLSLGTYNLVDSRNLGLENSDGVSDRRLGRALVVGDGSGAEGAGLHGGQ